jgi:hypothetical protein
MNLDSLENLILTHILQVVTPVRVNPMSQSGVPGFWIFGVSVPALVPSSGGFLATSTPVGDPVVVFCDYSDFSLEFPDWILSHKFLSCLGFIAFRTPSRTTGIAPEAGISNKDTTVWYLTSRPLAGIQYTTPETGGIPFVKDLSRSREESPIRHNLMTTGIFQPGILVTLKPTDEGPFGKDRNTLNPMLRTKDQLNGITSAVVTSERFV